MSLTLLALAAALGLALVHVFAGSLRFLGGIPRSRWLSAAGGVSVAYVFLHLIPELARAQEEFRAAGGWMLQFAERHVYLVALAGLAAFYGLEQLAVRSRRARDGKGDGSGDDVTTPQVFWLHMGSFGLYNVLIGYLLLHREELSGASLGMYFVAMALHFVVNDHGLREHHKHRYASPGRWILAAAVLTGWAVGAAASVPPLVVAVMTAFLAGGVILNVLKEELPRERQSRFLAFVLGASAYAALLLAI